MAQKEQAVHITIPDSELEIRGVLRGDYSSPLAILAPGLGSWMHDLLLFNASRFFEQEGIATLRVSLYGDYEKQRNIGDFGVKTNAETEHIVIFGAFHSFTEDGSMEWLYEVTTRWIKQKLA